MESQQEQKEQKPNNGQETHTEYVHPSMGGDPKNHLDAASLSKMHMAELIQVAQDAKIENINGLRKPALIAQILEARAKDSGVIMGQGGLEVLPDGFGVLRSPCYNYLPLPDDIYVSPSQIIKF